MRPSALPIMVGVRADGPSVLRVWREFLILEVDFDWLAVANGVGEVGGTVK